MRAKLAAALVGLGAVLANSSALAVPDVCPFVDGLDETIANTFPFPDSTTKDVSGTSTGTESIEVEWQDGDLVIIQYSTDGALNFTNLLTSVDASGSETLSIPADDDIILRSSFGVPGNTTGSIDFNCTQGTTSPTSPGSNGETAGAIAGAADDVREPEPKRVDDFVDAIVRSQAIGNKMYFESEVRTWLRLWKEKLNKLVAELAKAPPENRPLLEERIRYYQRDIIRFGAVAEDMADRRQAAAASSYTAEPTSAPSLSAISQQMSNASWTTGDWVMGAFVQGSLIERTFSALERRTNMGTLSIFGSHAIDDENTVGLGLKLGAGRTVQKAPASTIDTTQAGVDAAVAHFFSPTLMGAAYVGYEFDGHNATIAGVSSTYFSHIAKVGGKLEGTIDLDPFMLRPTASALLQFEHRPTFVDGAGVTVAQADTIDTDVTLGLLVSRTFLLVNHDVFVTPKLGAALDLSYVRTTPVPASAIPNDALTASLSAGVDVAWVEGTRFSAETRVRLSAHSRSLGLSGTFSAPIH